MMKLIGPLVLIFMTSQASFGKSLHEAVKEKIKGIEPIPSSAPVIPPPELGYIPIESFEYRTGFDTFEDQSVDRNTKEFGNFTQGLRIKMKSPTEILKSKDSVKTSVELMKVEDQATLNQQLYEAYVELVQGIFQSRLGSLLESRRTHLQAVVDKSAMTLGLSKINTKDLVSDLENLQKVDRLLGASKTQKYSLSEGVDSRLASDALLRQVKALEQKLDPADLQASDAGPLSIRAKRLENRLDRINKEVSWADDEKLLSFLEIRRDLQRDETQYRMAINIPWLRFDGLNKARDKALLYVKDRALERQSLDLNLELKTRLSEIQSLAAQIETLDSRLQKTRNIENRIRSTKDIQLKSVMNEFSFETELDLLLLGLEYYLSYLEYLKEYGTFARAGDVDLLHPEWKSFSL